jgi:hypothetical protein
MFFDLGVIAIRATEATPNTGQAVPNLPQYRRTGRSAKNADNATIKAIARRIGQMKEVFAFAVLCSFTWSGFGILTSRHHTL